MANVTLKLNPEAQAYLLAPNTNTPTLGESINSLFSNSQALNSHYYYFEQFKASGSKAVLQFTDGATRTYSGDISPTVSTDYYEEGLAWIRNVTLKTPQGIKETTLGDLTYSYTNNYGNLWIAFLGGIIRSYQLETGGKLASPLYGNLRQGFQGELQQAADGSITGTIQQLFTSAQRLLKNSITEGDFNLSSLPGGLLNISGTLHRVRDEYHDKSLFEVVDARHANGSSRVTLETLAQADFWQGDDHFQIELSDKATQALHIHSWDGDDSLVVKGGRGMLHVDAGNGDDIIRVLDSSPLVKGGSGNDTVESAFSYSLETLEDIENLTLYGSKAASATGNQLDNLLRGNSAANIIDGKAGADQMLGGAGNDTYLVDQAGDRVIEQANQGRDTVKASLSWVLSEHLENLELLGEQAIDGTGNALSNKLAGNSGNNRLDGAAGNDTLIGGAGDDTYVVDLTRKGQGVSLQDKIVEAAQQGLDTLLLRGEFDLTTHSSIRLANHLEHLDARDTGATRLHLTGNAADNSIYGNAADNLIIGGVGADILYGGAGRDTFRITSIKELGLAGRQDVILDFTRGEDLLDLKALKGYSFIATQSFSGLKQLRYEVDGNDLTLLGNASGDSQADFSIKLLGVLSLSSNDLLLS